MKNFLLQFKKKGIRTPTVIDPHRHWIILLRIFLLCFLVLIIVNFYLLYEIKTEKIFQVKPTIVDTTLLINEKALKNVTEAFSQKAQKENEIKINLSVYKDPSL